MKNLILFALLLSSVIACNPSKNCVENPKPDCMCTLQYDPVCGCNDKTYGNACAAECAGIKTYTKGECKQKNPVVLEGTDWRLIEFANVPEPMQVPDNVTINIKLENGKVSGNGGCNNVGGAYTLNGNNLQVTSLISTKMYCDPGSQWESKFLKAFEKSQMYGITGETLEINCGDMGNLVFRKQ